MRPFDLEHSSWAYRADFVLYGMLVAAMALTVLFFSPLSLARVLWAWVAGGVFAWTFVEYLLHRFVLHGLAPFRDWHAEHHNRPVALIVAPTLLSLGLFVVLVALPAWWLIGSWSTCALMLGLMTGYLGYGLTHHATHHTVIPSAVLSNWLAKRRRWHAVHHLFSKRFPFEAVHPKKGGPYGVSSGFWDHVFGTTNAAALANNTAIHSCDPESSESFAAQKNKDHRKRARHD